MADENKASYAKIGFTGFLGAVALAGALGYLGGMRGGGDVVYGETYVEKSVSGLSVGSPVNFRGLKVGKVSEIGFVGGRYNVTSPRDRNLIYVRMAFPREKLCFGDCRPEWSDETARRMIDQLALRATVTASGITGLSRVEIDSDTNVPPMQVAWTPKDLYIPPAVSLLDSFSDAATKVMNQINRIDIGAVWSNVHASVQALAKTAEGAQAMLESRRGDIDKVVGDLSETMSSVRELTEELRANPSLLIRERVPEPLPETER